MTPATGRVDLIVRGRRVVTPAGEAPASVLIDTSRGLIVAVGAVDAGAEGARVVDAGDAIVMPGIVDTHVHVNEPGRTEWEGFETASRAALAGGVTTICDMPLNAIPATTSVAALEVKRQAARASATVHVEYIGGVVPGNTGELAALHGAGVCAFKCFLTPSGVDEFAHVTERDLEEAFPVLAQLGLPLMVHAEDPQRLGSLVAGADARRYVSYLASRPAAAERSSIELLVRLMERWPTPVHIVHLSSAESLDVVRAARARGLPLTVETCPHYLTFAAEEIPDGATEYKCAPPIRGADEREALWTALADGEIDLVATDHSPCPPALKGSDGDFFAAWGGIASLQLSLPAVWTGAQKRGLAPARLVEWMCAGPARLAGLGDRKGALAAGFDADVVIWDPDARFVVDPAGLHHRHPVTPYAGRELFGVVRATYLGGRLVSGGV